MSDETTMPFDFSNGGTPSIIKVIGVGGGGGNAVNHMYREGIHDVTFVVCNTDNQALRKSPVPVKLQLGREGLGAGNRPARAKAAAEESMEDIENMLNDGCKMVFITAGMGGGTGTGAAPIIAKTLVINNERLRDVYSDLSVMNAFAKADDTLSVAAKSIAEIITIEGIINLDFNDVKTVLKDGGVALMSTGYGDGEGRVTQAINDAMHSPLLNNNDIFNSKKILFNISYSTNNDLMMEEMNEVHEFMSRFGEDVETKWGLYIDDSLEGKVKFTILATGFGIKDIPEMDDALTKKHTAEELKRREEEERIRQAKEKRRDDIYRSGLQNRKKKGNYKIYIFKQDDLDNDDVISMVDATPTYKRSKTVLESIQLRASANETHIANTSVNESGSTKIIF